MLRAFSCEGENVRAIVVTAPAKINLHLGIGGVRPDGFHDVTTVLHTLTLADTIRLTPAASFSLSCDTDLGIPAEQNLALRAARAFHQEFGEPAGVAIELSKRVPSGAGLAGGSSDAAAVLAGLAEMTGHQDDPRLATVARELGADAAFFLAGGAVLMAGRGDLIVRTLPPLEVAVALVKPPAPVHTALAYKEFDANPVAAVAPDGVIAALEAGDAAALGASLTNNMTDCAIALVPDVADALAWVSTLPGVLGAAVAGSGSSVFALCADEGVAARIANEAPARGLWGVATTTSLAGVTWADG